MSLQFDQSGVFHTFCNICHRSHTQKCSDAKFQLGFIFMKNCTTSKIALENLSVTWRWTATQRIPIFFSLKSRALLILDVGLFAQSYWWRCISVGHGYLLRHVQFFMGRQFHSLIAIFSYWHLFPRLIFLRQFFPLIYFPKDMFSQWLFFLFTSFPTDFFSYRHVFQVSFFPKWHFFLFIFPNLGWK